MNVPVTGGIALLLSSKLWPRWAPWRPKTTSRCPLAACCADAPNPTWVTNATPVTVADRWSPRNRPSAGADNVTPGSETMATESADTVAATAGETRHANPTATHATVAATASSRKGRRVRRPPAPITPRKGTHPPHREEGNHEKFVAKRQFRIQGSVHTSKPQRKEKR
jgi:hypothetical protein